MPEFLHLPPVAQAAAVLVGVALAIVRLLTASKAFWWRFPEWLQKGLPAALVALGMLPSALEAAKSWLDVVTALVFAVGAWFTASRGDQRPVEPPKKAPPSDPDTTVSLMPPPTALRPQDRSRLHNDAPVPDDEPAEFSVWDWRPAVLAALAFAVLTMQLGCPMSAPPASPKPEPCSTVQLATIVAGCEVRIRLECKPDDQSCLVFQECKLAVKNWRACGGDL